MAKDEKDKRPVYRVSLKERKDDLRRLPLIEKDYESSSGAIKMYEDLVAEYSHKQGEHRKLIVEMQFIDSSGWTSTLKEIHINY